MQKDKIIQVMVTPESEDYLSRIYGLSENGNLYKLTRDSNEWRLEAVSPEIIKKD